MNQPKPSRRIEIAREGAFTLIELLIVVAIIAILAAIAVPNFLEAQVRSKISRSLADLRSIKVGMEAYFVDNNAYPTDPGWTVTISSENGWLMLSPAPAGAGISNIANSKKYLGAYLTTPMSYLASVPMDYFNSNIRRKSNFYPPGHVPASYFATIWPKPAVMNMIAATPAINAWILQSCGPDLWWAFIDFPATAYRYDPIGHYYDPTNGTISAGDLFMTDKGFLSPNISGLPFWKVQ